jgi:hypothetical protein
MSEWMPQVRQCGFASPAQLLSFLAVSEIEIGYIRNKPGQYASPILRRRLPRGLPKRPGEVGLARKF